MFLTLISLAIATAVPGQNLLPNPGLEQGAESPAGWRLKGSGEWSRTAMQGARALQVEGNGENDSYWRTTELSELPGLRAGGLYLFSFYGRRESGSSSGGAVSGLTRANRDFAMDAEWRQYRTVFAVPADGQSDFLRLGQWHARGRMSFDELELRPVQAVHTRAGQLELGEGERIEAGAYHFSPQYGWLGGNYHRPLWFNGASFNSDRLVFNGSGKWIYRFDLPGMTQTNGSVRMAINYYESGALQVEASRDATNWLKVAVYDGSQRGGTAEVPRELYPAQTLFLRLSLVNGRGGLQVNRCDYDAELTGQEAVQDLIGQTVFFEVLRAAQDLAVQLLGLERNGKGRVSLEFAVSNALPDQPLQLKGATAVAGAKPGDPRSLRLAGGQSARLKLEARVERAGTHLVEAAITDGLGAAVFSGRTEARVPFQDDPRIGYPLGGTADVSAWWCESGWKVGPETSPPGEGAVRPIRVSAARGEYEPVQVVLRPLRDSRLLSAEASLSSRRGYAAPIEIRVDEVAFVRVTQPTDGTCERGWYPDPLPRLQTPLLLRKHRNQPLWLTFRIGADTKPGDYQGTLRVETTTGTARLPLVVHVFDFELPVETHLRSALGLGAGGINRYHNLTNSAQKEEVFEKYLLNFAEHRISPYSFFDHAGIDIRFSGQGAEKRATVDFTRFDAAAAKWLDRHHFNSFLLPLRGMGGGTYASRALGQLEGFKEGTPEHAKLFKDYLGQVETHLRERGWLHKAYTYWFDEPEPKDYEFVRTGMQRIKEAAPGIRRMLTEQPERELENAVEIWCGLTPEWTPGKVRERQAAGQEVWWYICCGPKAPYVTEFIDHPGTELRLWPWQSWQYGVEGILIWATIYWTSPGAFPPPSLQDPWADPMSYVSDSTPAALGYWGNGDGRFLYPPRREPGRGNPPCLDGPINSVRWENLRDGMEDYEYFWLLKQQLGRVRALGRAGKMARDAEALLQVPREISTDLTHFTTEPQLILQHRQKIAEAIEQLQQVK